MNIKTAVGLLMLCSTGAQAGLLSLLDVATLKESELEMCPNISVEKMVNSFFEDPEWTGGKAADGRKLVNVSGTITYASQPARAMVQVWVQDDGFSVEALEINGRPQPEGMLDLLLEKMCQSARGTDHIGDPQQQAVVLPFTGTRYFNFGGENGIQQSITIAPNGRVTLRSHGATSVSVDYQGMYENPLLTPAGNYRVHADKINLTDEGGDLPDPSECEVIVCETELSTP